MSRGNKIDWVAVWISSATGCILGYAIVGVGLAFISKADEMPWWIWAVIPVETFLVGLTFQVINPTGAPKRWFRKD